MGDIRIVRGVVNSCDRSRLPSTQEEQIITLRIRRRDGSDAQIAASTGVSLMEALRDSGLGEILALCGGCCCCGTCHVYVDRNNDPTLPPIGEAEEDLLDSSDHRMPDSRLSCQIVLDKSHDGLAVTIAPED